MTWIVYNEEDPWTDIPSWPTISPNGWYHVSYSHGVVEENVPEWKEKDKYSAEDLRSTMESIKTRLIILCEMRGL
jgi:hypothetical protein